MKKPKLTRNRFLILIGIVGLLLSLVVAPVTEYHLVIGDEPELLDDQSLPLPPIGPREQGFSPLNEPFLFQLGDTDKMTGLQRERILKNQYHGILTSLGEKKPQVEVKELMGMTVVTIGDVPFVTVLPSDAPSYYSRLTDERKKQLERQIAAHWKQIIESDLNFEMFWRSANYLAVYPYIVTALFFLFLIIFALTDSFSKRVLKSPGWSLKSFVLFGFLSLAAGLHPVLKPIATALSKGGLAPVFFFLIIFTFCDILYRLGCMVLNKYTQAYLASRKSVDARMRQRLETMTQGGHFLIGTLVTVLGVLWFFSALDVDLGQVFAGAGIAGIAIGVVGKDILIDYIYGINILLDDQFSLGDFIETAAATGTVESFNLRSTRIRESDGGLTIVTNGHFNIIKNHSREFAKADFRISVAYESDTEVCFALIAEEISLFAEESPEKLDAKPVLLGVHELADSGVILRAVVRTAALAQWAVKRELNRRILARFKREGIEIPFPQLTVRMHQPQSSQV